MSSLRPNSSYHGDAKEYARFCRIHRIFLVDGIGAWRNALKARGLSEAEIRTKVSAAAHFVRLLGDALPDVAASR
ncbi:MAG TPA: hypothetical protein VMV03_00005, partial [Spirochaetia bacterium]|nr:hypothetical protein [Spirochaetia bacterium]